MKDGRLGAHKHMFANGSDSLPLRVRPPGGAEVPADRWPLTLRRSAHRRRVGHTGPMGWRRTSTVDHLPTDPVGDAVGEAIAELLGRASVELRYSPAGAPLPPPPDGPAAASATGDGPSGWKIRLTVRLSEQLAQMVTPTGTPLREILVALPTAGLRAAAQFATVPDTDNRPLSPSLRKALRDTIVIEALSRQRACGPDAARLTRLLAETVDYLVELSGTRVESHDLTHGVVITDVLHDTPRLRFEYPGYLRAVKRAPLLFDGQRSLLIVDREGRARTELQSHRLDRLTPGARRLDTYASEFSSSGALVSESTRRLGGIGFFLRADRTIWVFAGGQPLLLRRGERWSAFPVELASTMASTTGANPATADLLVQTAFMISAQRRGAILAIVDDPTALDGIVAPKDRYDLRNTFDPMAMQTETRLHHLLDAETLDAQTLARLAALDGATILDGEGNLIAYGAIVTSSDSRHEGARTAAATTLSRTARIVLKISVDGDITVVRGGEVVATLLS